MRALKEGCQTSTHQNCKTSFHLSPELNRGPLGWMSDQGGFRSGRNSVNWIFFVEFNSVEFSCKGHPKTGKVTQLCPCRYNCYVANQSWLKTPFLGFAGVLDLRGEALLLAYPSLVLSTWMFGSKSATAITAGLKVFTPSAAVAYGLPAAEVAAKFPVSRRACKNESFFITITHESSVN